MTNRDELRSIHAKLIEDNGWSAMQSVKYIRECLNNKVSESTVWNWLSANDNEIPELKLELLKNKI